MPEATTDQLVDSFYSAVCPACGERKREERSLCYRCFCSLPHHVRDGLSLRFGHGYEQMMTQALESLGCTQIHEETDDAA